jgi:V-type H+-transporting ATPase subunit H
LFAEKGETYAKLYIDLLRKLQRVDTVQSVLVAIAEMLSGGCTLKHVLTLDPTTIPLFHNLRSEEFPSDPYGPIVKCLSIGDDEFVILESLRVLALLASWVAMMATLMLEPTLNHSHHLSCRSCLHPCQHC